MSEQISDETVQRMVALVRDMVARHNFYPDGTDSLNGHPGWAFREARDLAALLPKPVDPDILAVREICAQEAERCGRIYDPENFRSGAMDGERYLCTALAAYRAGRALTQGTER